MSRGRGAQSPKGVVRHTKYTREQVLRGAVEIVGLIIVLVLTVIMFMKLAPLSPNSGIREVSVTVVHADGSENPYTVTSEKSTLGEALEDGGLMADGALDGETGTWLCAKNGADPTADWQPLILKTGDRYVFTLDK